MARKRKSLREKQQSKIQSRITDFWKIGERKTVGGPMENFKLTKKTRINQLEAMQEIIKSKSENAKYFPDKLENDMYSSVIWGRKLDLMEELKVTTPKFQRTKSTPSTPPRTRPQSTNACPLSR